MLGACLLVGAISAQARQPNIVFIAVDDLRTELRCYGHDYVQSPNLDRLASQGVLFRRHYAQVPTCGASRYALLTGRSPAHSHALSNTALYRGASRLSSEASDAAQTFPELFRRSGYRTVLIGKISHTPDGKVYDYRGRGKGRDELPNAWDELATPYGPWRRGWGSFFAYAGGAHREDGAGHRALMEFVAEKDTDLPDGLMAKRAVAKLAELKARQQPFLLGLGFFKPHLPFVATRADWAAFADVEIPPPPHPGRIASPYWHKSGEFYGYRVPWKKTRPLARKDQIAARRAYLACVRYVDRQVGKVLTAIDELGLRESTIVIVWGDHGWHLGDSAMWGKHSPFERALRSTCILRAPGVAKPGQVCDALVETIDLYPTLVDLCKPSFTKTRYPLDGRSLRPLLVGDVDAVHEAALSYWRKAVSVCTLDYRLLVIGAKRADIELYDLRASLDPVDNLAADEPELVQRLLRLAGR